MGRLKDDQYRYQGKTYHQTQHGFARDMNFVVTEHFADRVTLRLTDTPATHQVYPFQFDLTVTYQLVKTQLKVNYTVGNPAEQQTLRYAIGAHPGFNIPLSHDLAFENVDLEVIPAAVYPQIKLIGPYNDLQHPSELDFSHPHQLSHCDFHQDALILVTNYQPLTVSLTEPSTGHGVHVHVPKAPFVGVWSSYPKVGNFVCVEPWWGIADNIHADGELTHKNVFHRLPAGHQAHYQFSIEPF